MQPLNPRLATALETLFGKFKIAKRGEKRTTRYEPDYARPGMYKITYDSGGEEFQINCPFCGDTSFRMHVNYTYGEYDRKTGTFRDHLIYCFNEGCHKK